MTDSCTTKEGCWGPLAGPRLYTFKFLYNFRPKTNSGNS